MKIWRSRPKQDGTRDVVLDLTRREEHEVVDVLRTQVFGRRAPKRNVRRNGDVRYRFAGNTLDRLLATFPFAELSPGLDARARRQSMAAISEPVPELDLPDFDGELYDFQKIGVARILRGIADHGSFFLNDEMGLGKTVQAIAAMISLQPFPVLVVCPNSAKWVWERMVQSFSPYEVAVVDATKQNKHERTELIRARMDVTVINVESLRLHPELATIDYGLIITDEYHRFKNPKAAQTVAWHALKSEADLLMSGTPLLNRLEEIWSALHQAFPDRYPNYWMFEKWLCIKSKPQLIPKRDAEGHILRDARGNVIMQRIPGRVVGYKPEPFEALKKHLHEPLVSVRRRKDQVLDDIPEVVTTQLLVELTREQRRLYNEIVDNMRLELESGEIQRLSQIIQVVTRTKQACFSPELYGGSATSAKLDELKVLVREIVDSGRKALIGSQWARATKILARELAEYDPAYVDGKVTGHKRMAQIDKFNETECPLYIGTLKANREAITLGGASYVVLTDKDWSPLTNDQFIGRSGAGGLRGLDTESDNIQVIELFAHDTVEAKIDALLNRKRAMFNAFVENDGGAIRKLVTVGEIAALF